MTVGPVELEGSETELQAMGWTKNEHDFTGWLNAQGIFVQGKLEKQHDGTYKTFVKAPPKEIFKGGHRHCFRHVGDNWFDVHFEEADLTDPITLIREVQDYIIQSCPMGS